MEDKYSNYPVPLEELFSLHTWFTYFPTSILLNHFSYPSIQPLRKTTTLPPALSPKQTYFHIGKMPYYNPTKVPPCPGMLYISGNIFFSFLFSSLFFFLLNSCL